MRTFYFFMFPLKDHFQIYCSEKLTEPKIPLLQSESIGKQETKVGIHPIICQANCTD